MKLTSEDTCDSPCEFNPNDAAERCTSCVNQSVSFVTKCDFLDIVAPYVGDSEGSEDDCDWKVVGNGVSIGSYKPYLQESHSKQP